MVVQDHVHLRDVETAGGDVGGDEDGGLCGGGETFEGAEAGLLGHLGVEGEGVDGEVGEEGGDSADGRYGVCEDYGALLWIEEQDGVEVEILDDRVRKLTLSEEYMLGMGNVPCPLRRIQSGPP